MLARLVRGLSYLPPVEPTWEDLLHAVLAAAEQLVPTDESHSRDAIVHAFTTIGVWRAVAVDVPGLAGHLRYPIRLSELGSDPEEVVRLIWENPALIDAACIDQSRLITVDRVRQSVRVSPNGFVVSEISASFTQEFLLGRADTRRFGLPAIGSVMMRGGGLLRFDEGGRLSFAAFAPTVSVERQRGKIEAADAAVAAPHSTGTSFHPRPVSE